MSGLARVCVCLPAANFTPRRPQSARCDGSPDSLIGNDQRSDPTSLYLRINTTSQLYSSYLFSVWPNSFQVQLVAR